MTVSLLIADDHEVVRQGLASLLAGTDVQIVAEAANPADAVELARRHKPNVALLDIRMVDGGDDGLTALERIHHDVPETKVVMLSAFDNPTYIARANALGAADYLLKGCTREQLLDTIRSASAGTATHGELGKVAGTMAAPERKGRRKRAYAARNSGAAPSGAGLEQQGNRQIALDQCGNREGARAARAAQDQRQRPHTSRRLGRAQGNRVRKQAAGGGRQCLRCLSCRPPVPNSYPPIPTRSSPAPSAD